jgi:hypothetical protein
MNASYEAREGYLYVQATGEFTTSSALLILSKLIKMASDHSCNAILGDITQVTGLNAEQTSMTTLFDMGVNVANLMPRDFKLAVLVTWEQLPDVLFGENVMMNRGTTVKVTTHLDDALKWLQSYHPTTPLEG